jgi:hypothetical protein
MVRNPEMDRIIMEVVKMKLVVITSTGMLSSSWSDSLIEWRDVPSKNMTSLEAVFLSGCYKVGFCSSFSFSLS